MRIVEAVFNLLRAIGGSVRQKRRLEDGSYGSGDEIIVRRVKEDHSRT
jgi:hypothetical protein